MITRLKQYITPKDCVKDGYLKRRTIYDQMRRNAIKYVTVCGNKMVVQYTPREPSGVSIGNLRLVSEFAKSHKYAPDTIYKNIIMDKINAVVIGDLILVNPEDQTVIDFLKNNPPSKRK